MGACAITVSQTACISPFRVTRGSISLSTSYATGGDTVSTSNLGLSAIYLFQHDVSRNGVLYAFSYNANKIQSFYPQGNVAPGGTTIGVMTMSGKALPTGAVAMTASTGWPDIKSVMSAGAGIEMQSGADLSGEQLQFLAWGY